MRLLQTDLSIYNKFDFEYPPVGVKYEWGRPEGIERVEKEKRLALCEMLKEAHQRRAPFYFTKDDEDCFGARMLGMTPPPPPSGESGQLGVRFEIFQEARANAASRRHRAYNMQSGTVNYAIFSPLDKLTFEPDLLILTANPRQTEIVERANTYSTGEMFESKMTHHGGCYWLYVYPYLSGKVNYMITGLTFGMKAREVFPDGLILISIPYQRIPEITQNLKEMKWVIMAYTLGREKFLEYEHRIIEGITEEFKLS